MRILIAEDERITRMTLQRQLQGWGHDVVAAEDGEQAWEQFAASAKAPFDLVMTDWEMPRLSGLELVRRIREAQRAVYTYVVILTSRSDKADIVNGIEAGADDFVSKPFDREELRVRLLAGERVVGLERALTRQNGELREASERIHQGLQAASRIQRAMLPQQSIVTRHVRAVWEYIPTEELAGDAIGLHLIDDRYLVCYVLDVSGHGVPAALLSVAAMHALVPEPEDRSLIRDMTAASGIGTLHRPSHVATEMNRRFRAGENDGRFLTMLLCVLDTHEGRLHFTSAGHPPAVVLRNQMVVPFSNAGGLPLAIDDAADYEDDVLQLQPNDRVYLFSDGLLEQYEPSGSEQFGDSRLAPLLVNQSQTPPEQAVTRVVGALSEWAGGKTFDDDVSLVLIEWLGP